MDAIKHALTERWYAYEEAKMLYEEERLGKKNWRDSVSISNVNNIPSSSYKTREIRA